MSATQLTGRQVQDGSIGRPDLNVLTAGQAVITKILEVANSGIKINASSGVDAGTGDVSLKVDTTYLDTLYARRDAISGQRIWGRYATSAGALQEISLGNGLILTSGLGVLSLNMAKADVEAVLVGPITSHTHDYIPTAATSISVIGNGGVQDPYGTIAVSQPANANSYSYFGLTRNSNIGMGIGINTSNEFFIGATTAGNVGSVLNGTAYLKLTGAAANFSGTATATTFIGALTGTATNAAALATYTSDKFGGSVLGVADLNAIGGQNLNTFFQSAVSPANAASASWASGFQVASGSNAAYRHVLFTDGQNWYVKNEANGVWPANPYAIYTAANFNKSTVAIAASTITAAGLVTGLGFVAPSVRQDAEISFVNIANSAYQSIKTLNVTATGTIAGSNLSGSNSGDNAANSLYSGLVTNAAHTGDAIGSGALTVKGINGTLLSGLATGILKNTTGTGVPSIAVAADFPTLNQSTTGNAATATKLATARTINGVAFDGTSNISVGVNTFNSRSGDVSLTSTDVTNALGYTPIGWPSTNWRTVTGNTDVHVLGTSNYPYWNDAPDMSITYTPYGSAILVMFSAGFYLTALSQPIDLSITVNGSPQFSYHVTPWATGDCSVSFHKILTAADGIIFGYSNTIKLQWTSGSGNTSVWQYGTQSIRTLSCVGIS